MRWERDIELLTPTFCRGAYQDTPELRVPSMRGMVRWWFRALGGRPEEERAIFGGLHGGATASRMLFRVTDSSAQRAAQNPPALPHKPGGQGNPQAAFSAGGKFHLRVLSRLGNLPPGAEDKASKALEVWLLLGSLGLRSNRAGGSLWPDGPATPKTPADLRKRLDELGCRWPVYLAGLEVGSTPEALRAAATDTVPEPHWVFGSIRPRQSSSLKFKVVRLENKLRLLITADDERTITEAQRALRGHRSKPETWQKILSSGQPAAPAPPARP